MSLLLAPQTGDVLCNIQSLIESEVSQQGLRDGLGELRVWKPHARHLRVTWLAGGKRCD